MAAKGFFRSLRDILSTGGEIALGLVMLAEPAVDIFKKFFDRKFEPLEPEDRRKLIDLSGEMVDAGKSMALRRIEEALGPRDFPLNEFLFGGSMEGRRVLITGEIEIPGMETRIQVRMAFPNIPTIEEIQEGFLGRGLEIVSLYPEKFGLKRADIPTTGNVHILLPERAF